MTKPELSSFPLFVAAALSLPFLQRSSAQNLAPQRLQTIRNRLSVTRKVEQFDDYFGTKVTTRIAGSKTRLPQNKSWLTIRTS